MATKHDWTTLDPLIDQLKAQGWNDTQVAKDLGIGRQTLVDHLRAREPVHLSTPERTDSTEVHQDTPEHLGTLEAHREVLEEVHQSVPDAPHVGTDEVAQETLEPPSTPEVHPGVSPDDSPLAHSGVPARQDQGLSTPMGHPSTPTADDWELWSTMKARWPEIEKMLSDRQVMLSTPRGTPGHTQKKTYVFDVRHIALIEQYAQEHRLNLKDVVYSICEEFFQRHGWDVR
jgi:Bacterial regulatory protein, Fis family